MLRAVSNSMPFAQAALLALLGMSMTVSTAAAAPPPKPPPPPSPPPAALPVHSALPEEARPANPAPAESAPRVSQNVPSAEGPEFITVPPFGEPQTSAKIWPEEPQPAPAFSWRPTIVHKDARQGSWQGGLFRTTYLPRFDGAGGFGITTITKQSTFAVPPFFYGNPILITPSIGVNYLDGPASLDLPSRLHDFELEFRYMRQVTGRFGFDSAIAPAYFGDLKNDSSDAWRLTGRFIAAWDWSPTLKFVGGAWFLGREDIPVSPIFGGVWKPNDCWQVDAVFPRPRVYYRFEAHDDVKNWIYVGGEFGGNSWAIDRAGGVPDKVTYRDLRLVVGWERTKKLGLNGRLELGWVFDREIEYVSNIAKFYPDDTLMLRGELSY